MQILIDANALFHKSYAISQKYADPIYTDKGKSQLYHRAVTDLISFLKLFPQQTQILWLQDGPSWRKGKFGTVPTGFKFDAEAHQTLYKHNRKNIHADFYKVFNAFSTALSELGIVTSKIEGLEADDLAMLFVHQAKQNAQTTVCLTLDHDWDQLVETQNDYFIGVYNHHSKNKTLYLEKDIDTISNIKKKIVDPKRLIIEKIFGGDYSDNIPSIFDNGKSSGKVRGKKLEKLTDWFFSNYESPLDLAKPEVLDGIKEQLTKIFKNVHETAFDTVNDMVLANMVFMYLIPDFLPEHLVTEWQNNFANKNSTVYNIAELNESIRAIETSVL